MKYIIAVCDDDKEFAGKITEAVSNEFALRKDAVEIDYYDNGNTFIENVQNGKLYDAVFLDINMEPVDGFEVATQLASLEADMHIIFITSYDEVVYDSFDYTPFYFVRKSRYEKYIKNVVEKLIKVSKRRKMVLIEDGNSRLSLYTDEIIYAVSEDHYITIYTNESEYVMRKSLSDFEQEMSECSFIRIHKKYVINYKFVKRIDESKEEVVLTNNIRLKIGRRYKEMFRKGLTCYYRTI